MKNNKIIWIIAIIALIIIFNGGDKQFKKESGESSTRSFISQTIPPNQQTTISITINPGTSTYYAINEIVPAGWTVTSTSDGGDYTTNPGRIYWVILNSAGQHTYTYTANPGSSTGTKTFTGTIGFAEKPEAAISGSTSVSVVACTSAAETCDNKDNDCDYLIDESLTSSCGTGGCVGIRTCNAGVWGTCSTVSQDCGTCCICSSTAAEIYDGNQDTDCPTTTCPSDGCGLGTCGTNIFANYPNTVQNQCSALKICSTTNTCTLTCEADSDADTYSLSCGDCNATSNKQYPTNTEICGDGIDNDCSGASESYFNKADLGTPNGFCTGTGCCNSVIDMNELLVGIGKWKISAFTMNDLLSTIGKWKVG